MAYRVQISTDGLNAYVLRWKALSVSSWITAKSSRLTGMRKLATIAVTVLRSLFLREKKIVVGNPDERLISTSYVERLNATTRLAHAPSDAPYSGIQQEAGKL